MVQNERESNFGYECTGCPVSSSFVPSSSKIIFKCDEEKRKRDNIYFYYA